MPRVARPHGQLGTAATPCRARSRCAFGAGEAEGVAGEARQSKPHAARRRPRALGRAETLSVARAEGLDCSGHPASKDRMNLRAKGAMTWAQRYAAPPMNPIKAATPPRSDRAAT